MYIYSQKKKRKKGILFCSSVQPLQYTLLSSMIKLQNIGFTYILDQCKVLPINNNTFPGIREEEDTVLWEQVFKLPSLTLKGIVTTP